MTDHQKSDQDKPQKQKFFALVTLGWQDAHLAPGQIQLSSYLVQSGVDIDVDPRSDRKRLHDDVFAWAVQSGPAPATAAVEFISIEPAELPHAHGPDGQPIDQDFYCSVTIEWRNNLQVFTRTRSDVVPVQPGTSRSDLVYDLIERTRIAFNAPADAAVVALTVLPNAMGL